MAEGWYDAATNTRHSQVTEEASEGRMTPRTAKMTSRQRVLAAIERREPDRVPVDLGGHISGISRFAYARLLRRLGMGQPIRIFDQVQQLVEPDEEVLRRLGVDVRYVHARPPDAYPAPRDIVPYDPSRETEDSYASGHARHTFVDEWGITYRRAAYYYEMVDHPLRGKGLAEARQYRFPDPDDSGRWRGLGEQARDLYESTDYAIVCSLDSGGIFEMPHFLLGFEDSLFHLGRGDELAHYLLDRVTEYLIAFWENFLNAVRPYAHVVQIGDDYGMQDRMLISPAAWRRLVKPRYARLIARIKAKADVKVLHHSCGSIVPIIGDLAEIGVDVLNPVQPRARDMESGKLKAEYGSIICFHGGIDVQHVLPFGNAEDVRQEVRKRIQALAPGGGYILAASHNIQADVPVDNVLAFFEAAQEFGHYPIRLS
jgi:uroporphyrinogen decarboxylase